MFVGEWVLGTSTYSPRPMRRLTPRKCVHGDVTDLVRLVHVIVPVLTISAKGELVVPDDEEDEVEVPEPPRLRWRELTAILRVRLSAAFHMRFLPGTG